ncbi:MAG: hypothetical protein F2916_05445 [Actinobacteria bacterium]|nr:hypothetical protein [Actinomycetota bacterium]
MSPVAIFLRIRWGNEDFSTLVVSVTAAGLGEALSGEGPLTVFAPTNAAFEALPAGLLDKLLLHHGTHCSLCELIGHMCTVGTCIHLNPAVFVACSL